MKKQTLALDWTPNINHIGFFVAKEKGFYRDENIDINIINPAEDNYQTTPAKKVEKGLADFALCPLESILSYQTKSNPFNLKAIATIFQEDLSAIVVERNANINSPKDLDGKSYASYKAKYEDEIVKQLIKNDGGKGDLQLVYPEKLGIWETILNYTFDATWIFLNWEGVAAEATTNELQYFKLKDYDIPYSYSPVIAVNGDLILENKTEYASFLKATKKGFLYCLENPKESCNILNKFVPENDAYINLEKALSISKPALGNSTTWGKIDAKNVQNFIDWLANKNLETQQFPLADIFTNELNE